MKTLTYTQPHGADLADQLQAQVPTLAASQGPLGPTAVFALLSDGDQITLHVPDDADETAIAAIVAATPS